MVRRVPSTSRSVLGRTLASGPPANHVADVERVRSPRCTAPVILPWQPDWLVRVGASVIVIGIPRVLIEREGAESGENNTLRGGNNVYTLRRIFLRWPLTLHLHTRNRCHRP